MKQKLFTLFLALVASVGTLFAQSGTCGANLTWDLTDGVLTISGTGDMTNFDYGSSPCPWYSYRVNIKSVTIGNSVTSIGSHAFYNCTGLTSVTIPNSVTGIGSDAFYDCAGLTSVTLPNSVTSIGSHAFGGCTGLTSPVYNAHVFAYMPTSYSGSYSIPDGIESIAGGAFASCTGLTSVTLPNSVTSIGDDAFRSCTGLTSPVYNAHVFAYMPTSYSGSYSIPDGIESIAGGAFYYCTGLTSVTLPNSVTSIGDDAFKYCSGLTSVTLPNSVTSIGSYAFQHCSGLTSPVYNAHVFAYMPTSYSGSYSIPDGIESIAGGAFYYCTGLTFVTIPNSVTSIGMGAFYDCAGLTSITIPNSVTIIREETFINCTSLTSITIPNSVTSIGDKAFLYCTGVTSITIGNSVTSIGSYAFYDCADLKTIYNYAESPQEIYGVFPYGVDKSVCKLYVPVGSIDLYKAADVWKNFTNILPIAAEETETTEAKVTPDATTADVVWPKVDNAYTYELVIKDKDGKVICRLTFNAQGQLTSIAFKAPAHGDAPQKTQTAGFAFIVSGLESGTTYNYTLTAKNEGGSVLKVEEGSFTTKAPQGIDDVEADSKSTKVLRDGQVFIQKGEKTFTITGQEVK